MITNARLDVTAKSLRGAPARLRGAAAALIVLSTSGALGQTLGPTTVQPPVGTIARPPAKLAPPILSVSGGGMHTCAILKSTGGVMCWGLNANGQLGDGTTTSRTTPGLVPGLTGVQQLALGYAQSCALLGDGTVRCWGQADVSQVPTPTAIPGLTNVVQITAGVSHACARTSEAVVRCWGRNELGQLGDGTRAAHAKPAVVPGLLGVAEVAAGWNHTCARLADGTVKCWGSNSMGQVGSSVPVTATSAALLPVDIPGLKGYVASGLALGLAHTCALVTNGTVRCWGDDHDAQLGDGTKTTTTTPVAVAGLSGATQVTSGMNTGCARVQGGVQCWGWFGLPASGPWEEGHSPWLRPVKITDTVGAPISDVRAISAGGGHACAVLQNDTVMCWGYNRSGELGATTGTCTEGAMTFPCSKVAVNVIWP